MTTFAWLIAVAAGARWGYLRGMRKEYEEPGSYEEGAMGWW